MWREVRDCSGFRIAYLDILTSKSGFMNRLQMGCVYEVPSLRSPFFFGLASLPRSFNKHFAIFFSVMFCASVSHDLEWHSVEIYEGASEEHLLLDEHHENHLHDSAYHPDQAHESDLACDFFHGDLPDISYTSDIAVSSTAKTAEAEYFLKSSFSKVFFNYKARAPPRV